MINESLFKFYFCVPQVHRATEDSEGYAYDDLGGRVKADFLSKLDIKTVEEVGEVEVSPESAQSSQVGAGKTEYKRTLSGGLKSPKADVPKKAILQRINSKKIANSYQLGHQLSLKWTTGAGPRIGCVADYPVELRVQALEFLNLSPITPSTPSYSKRITSLISTPMTDTFNAHHHTSNFSNYSHP